MTREATHKAFAAPRAYAVLLLLLLPLLSACQSRPAAEAPAAEAAAVEADMLLEHETEPGQPAPTIHPVLTIVEKPDLWRDIRRSFVLERPLDQRRLQQELRWLKRHPNYLKRLKPRLEQHLAYIHQRVTDRDLPGELALLPIVESALDPYAFSPGGAAGLWQFIPATAKRFGLSRNWWYDGRRDPVAATEAALDYLEYLERRFGDWSLALAGYNTGEGNVQRARRRAGSDASFWELKLPRETSAYVPRLLAIAELVSNPDAYGVTLPELSPEIPFVIVATGSQYDLSVAAEVSGLEVETLYRWNPALNQWSTPPAGPHHLLLPRTEDVQAVQARLEAVPKRDRVRWMRVKVKQGDTLSQLAQRHSTDVASLRRANNLPGSSIRAGQALLIPKSAEALSNPVASRGRSAGSKYVVREGDSLWTISRAQGVSMNRLMRANHVGPKDVLRVGQTLTIPGGSQSQAGQGMIRKVRYGVRRGDSLARIAGKFNVSVKEITNWNALDPSAYLQPGQRLTLYVDVAAGAD